MESWVELVDIFMNSPCPESEASLWLRQSFNASSTTTTNSFISLLTKPFETVVVDSSSTSPSSPPHTKRVMWIQTLPNTVQSRILSFLAFDRQRFCASDLTKLAHNVLNGNLEIDFWVKKTARQLLDAVSQSDYEWVSSLNLDSEEDRVDEEFESLPNWLKEEASTNDLVLPWLPISTEELNSRMSFGTCGDVEDSEIEVDEEEEDRLNEVVDEVNMGCIENDTVNPEIEKKAACLRTQILTFESVSRTVNLANEIRQLCLERGADSLTVLGLIEPWEADDETGSVLISHVCDGSEEELGWPSHVLCSILLPKLLVLKEPASRVLVTATIEYCKIHQRAAVYALLFPLILRKEGINNSICDVTTRIIKECLHPAHVSAFCQKLLSGEEDTRKFICLPCHQDLISNELNSLRKIHWEVCKIIDV
ncbi:uncharacterized protein LOC132277116 isoform X2 [Cornus florida]|uniref:uncharacterized protein LOC132277116 isoform X2 n=1 Tax=Cornus florida TaxID=4283 RepID=UPI00289E5CFB|nr:uncharacterized protein LOC132277116 isoform X2 [Cornus florida]